MSKPSSVPLILLIDHTLAHYRQDFYNILDADPSVKIEAIGGKNYLGISTFDLHQRTNFHLYNYRSFKILHHQFFFSWGIIRHYFHFAKCPVVCTGIDFHLPHTLFIFFVHRLILHRKFYWWTHGTDGNQGRVGRALRAFIYKKSTALFAYAQNGKLNLIKMGISSENISVVNNALNLADYGFLKYNLYKYPRNIATQLNIIYSGRVTDEKNINFLIRSLHALKNRNLFNFKCTIVGGGDLEPQQLTVKQLDLENHVIFAGPKYGPQIDEFFLNADLMVYPSGIGLSIVHAFSYGVPVITTNRMDLHRPEVELLTQGVNGDFYVDDDCNNLADKIVEWRQMLIDNREHVMAACVQSIHSHNYFPQTMKQVILNRIVNNQ